MTDFGWLRIGQRSRTPSIPQTPTSPERRPRRATSNLSLASHSSHEPLTGSGDTSLFIREQDKIWYNPSLDQMVESLQVILMTQGTLQSIPIEYNSYVLHLIEGFANSQEQIQTTDAAYIETRQSLEHHLEHFKSVADEWLERESQYKAEIKRLEVLLSKTSNDGLEAVTLARTNSVVDRNGPQAKQFVSKLKRLSTQTIYNASIGSPEDIDQYDTKPVPKVLDKDSDFLMSEEIRRHDTMTTTSTIRRKVTGESGEDVGTGRRPETPITSADDIIPKPLFSDDISDASDVENGAGMVLIPPWWRRKQTRRQILEDLLDNETSKSNSKDETSLRPKSDHRHLSSCRLEEIPENMGRHLDDRRLRCLSGFSFVPGDDVSPIITIGGVSDEATAKPPAGTEETGETGLWKPCLKDMKENPTEGVNGEPVSDSSGSPESWETRLPSAARTIRPRDSCTSSLDTVVQASPVSPAVAAYSDSPRMPISPSSAFEMTRRRQMSSQTPGSENSE
ncbi:hypothetical protein F5Y11DRAFT_362510 [Daldinia sp. FL1419]|nr:hypothetical protein F5Y11DRAFT_362510 [Daldinia sp. FL1419]